MPINFPSMEFLKALQQKAAEGDEVLSSLGDEEIIFAIDVAGRMFVIEFAERACVALALSGNANDMDFVLTGSMEGWIKLLGAAGDEAEFTSLLQRGGPVDPVCDDDEGLALLEKAQPALQTFFAASQSFDWVAA